MLTKTEKHFSILFFVIVLIELLIGSLESFQSLHYFAKPAIVLSLILFFVKASKSLSKFIKNLTLLALIFSLFGDILLMFVDKSPHFFTFGLVSFLIAHIMYIMVFLKHRNRSMSFIGFMIFLLIYAVGLFYLLKDGLGDMLVPVIIYMLVILSMSTSAYLRRAKVENVSYYLVLFGAVLFMISDSILALNKFYQTIPMSNFSIMITYALAQYLIILGILKITVTNSKV
ncbi:lysoplasmalogenase [Ichthyenterobacterium sp. W332]|uniref:Lysoplasmalogenase n=1 Tax=Microcosmobacter mediterraneus TaxID=3075607 RepID=A0ABU2YHM5_9FLAO|nr:lysoplasmalogenase [Ichthyenterobacterium sp. W332]MDT0557396.1 lysoplasmalogenase [Ichthyenterobacterium sp. W332]